MYPKGQDQRVFAHDLLSILLIMGGPIWFAYFLTTYPPVPSIVFASLSLVLGLGIAFWFVWSNHIATWFDPELTQEQFTTLRLRTLFARDLDQFRDQMHSWMKEQEVRLDSKYGGGKK